MGLVILITVNTALQKYGLSIPLVALASLHAICPFGGVVSIYRFATIGSFVQKIHDSSFVLMIIAFILAAAKEIEFSTIKDSLQKLVDVLK